MHFSVTGANNIDDTYNVLAGIGDYLKTIPITQKELESYIISAVNEFDSSNNAEHYSAAQYYITNNKVESIRQTRNEILSTTIEDIKAYANVIDYVVGQKRVFVYTNKQTAEQSDFSFDYVIDASTLKVSE